MRKKSKIIRDKLKDTITDDVWTLFETVEEKKHRKKKQNERINKDRIITAVRTLFEKQEKEDYYDPKRVSNFRKAIRKQ